MKLRLLVGIVGMLMLANIADAAPFAYVLNRGSSQVAGSITVVDMATNAAVSNAANPITAVGGRPYSLAVSTKGGRIIVANQGGTGSSDQSLQIIDTDQYTVIGSLTGLTYMPTGIALNSAETRLYVADHTNSRVNVYDLNGNTMTLIGYLSAANAGAKSGLEGIVLDETAKRLYVAASFADKVLAFDLNYVENDARNADNSSRLNDVDLAGCTGPVGLVLANSKVYASCSLSNNVAMFNSASPSAITLIAAGTTPYGISASLDGSRVYVANAGDTGSSAFSNKLTIITTASNTPTHYNPAPTITDYVCSAAESPNQARFLATYVPSVEATAPAPSSPNMASVVLNSGIPGAYTGLTVGVNPCSLSNFMGPLLPYTLTTQITAGTGTIAPSQTIGAPANTVLAASGSYKTFKITPGASQYIQSVTVTDGTTPVSYGTVDTFTYGPITKNVTVQVAFDGVLKRALTTNISGGGNCTVYYGGITPPVIIPPATTGAADYAAGAIVPITVVADADSTFDSWTGCASPSGNVCTVTMPASATSVTANCSIKPYQAASDFMRGTAPYDSLQAAYDANGDSTIVANTTVTKSTAPVTLAGSQSVKIDGGYDCYGSKNKVAGVISTLPIGSLTISTTGTIEISEIAIQ